MIAELGRATPLWGFSQVTHVGNGGTAAVRPPGGPKVEPRDFLAHDPASFTLLDQDVMGPPENLFIDRDLFLRIGGYPAAPRDWGSAFALRAARDVEPVPVAQHLYLHAGTAGPRAGAAERTERVNRALAGEATATNEFCPQYAGNRDVLLRAELRAGHGDRLPVDMLRALAAQWRTRSTGPAMRSVPLAANGGTYNAVDAADKAALVVLGMYRSGTSAFARALNLCGAFLPARVSAAKLGLNPKGFWETEAVNDLDVRFMEVLGADWNRVGFELPGEGPLVDQFLTSSGELLATEYEDAPLIVIKDPRICVLAPMWHRALREHGYRPAYVVVVRHPVEVAGSIETQGDMPLSEGLALWLTYMRRVEAFVESGGVDVVHVSYPELLQDWRRVVTRVATTLAVPLDVVTRAGEIDRFLEAGMRTHQADDGKLDASVDAATAGAIRALYERMVERCDRDRAAARQR